MHPVLFKIPLFGGLTIYSYGVMIAAAFLVGLSWVMRESARQGEDPSKAMDLVFYIILSAIVGSRILHVFVSDWDRFLDQPLIFFKIWEGGLVFYGGFIAAVAVSIWYVRRHRMPFLKIADIFAPGIAIGHAVGRVGCMLAGCCYGSVAPLGAWYAITFPPGPRTFAPVGIPLYPTQWMESLGELSIFFILLVVRKFKRFDGQIIAVYLMLYALLRFFDEYFRGDPERGFLVPWLSTSQFISLIAFPAGVLLYVLLMRRAKSGGVT